MSSPPVVLVVENRPELLEALIDALSWEGYDVVPATDATTAATVLQSRPVHLLVADPSSVEGGEVALDLVESEFPELPIVAIGEGEPASGVVLGPWSTSGNRRTLRHPLRLGDLLAAARDAVGPPGVPDRDDEDDGQD